MIIINSNRWHDYKLWGFHVLYAFKIKTNTRALFVAIFLLDNSYHEKVDEIRVYKQRTSWLDFPHQPKKSNELGLWAASIPAAVTKLVLWFWIETCDKMGKLETRRVEDVQLTVPFKPFAIVTVSLPAFSLLYCFLHGIIFRFDDVNETVCKVIGLPWSLLMCIW